MSNLLKMTNRWSINMTEEKRGLKMQEKIFVCVLIVVVLSVFNFCAIFANVRSIKTDIAELSTEINEVAIDIHSLEKRIERLENMLLTEEGGTKTSYAEEN